MQLFAEILSPLNILENEIFVLGDINIDILQNGVNLLEKNVNTSKRNIIISSDVKNYIEFCSTLGLTQLIKVLTRIPSKTSTLIDHIVTSSTEKVVQAGIIETSLFDHQIIFCTRKVKKAKPNKRSYLTFCSMKNVSAEIYEETLSKLIFPDYKNFSRVNEAYSDLTPKVVDVVNKMAPTKTIRIKNNTNAWFDGEIADKIAAQDKTRYYKKKQKIPCKL